MENTDYEKLLSKLTDDNYVIGFVDGDQLLRSRRRGIEISDDQQKEDILEYVQKVEIGEVYYNWDNNYYNEANLAHFLASNEHSGSKYDITLTLETIATFFKS